MCNNFQNSSLTLQGTIFPIFLSLTLFPTFFYGTCLYFTAISFISFHVRLPSIRYFFSTDFPLLSIPLFSNFWSAFRRCSSHVYIKLNIFSILRFYFLLHCNHFPFSSSFFFLIHLFLFFNFGFLLTPLCSYSVYSACFRNISLFLCYFLIPFLACSVNSLLFQPLLILSAFACLKGVLFE